MKSWIPGVIALGVLWPLAAIAQDDQPSLGDLAAKVERELAAGYRRVKIKIKPGWDLEPVAMIRERFGPIPLMVDANAAYELKDAAHLAFDRYVGAIDHEVVGGGGRRQRREQHRSKCCASDRPHGSLPHFAKRMGPFIPSS